MTSFRNFAYATLLAFTALNFSPKTASAQEPMRGKFTLTHEVRFGNAKLQAGNYEFSFDPNATSRMLTLSKLGADRTAYLVVVPSDRRHQAHRYKPVDSENYAGWQLCQRHATAAARHDAGLHCAVPH